MVARVRARQANRMGLPSMRHAGGILLSLIVLGGVGVAGYWAGTNAVAPPTLPRYLSQQLRWRRSNLVDLLGGLTHVWRLHPVVSLHYFSTYALMLCYPVLVVRQLVHGHLAQITLAHACVLLVLGLVYRHETRGEPEFESAATLPTSPRCTTHGPR